MVPVTTRVDVLVHDDGGLGGVGEGGGGDTAPPTHWKVSMIAELVIGNQPGEETSHGSIALLIDSYAATFGALAVPHADVSSVLVPLTYAISPMYQ